MTEIDALAERWTTCHPPGEHAEHCDATTLARAVAERMAQAWDDGFIAARGHLSDYRPNPYRDVVLPPGEPT